MEAEVASSATYYALAQSARNARWKKVLLRLGESERNHAIKWASKLGKSAPEPGPEHVGGINRLLVITSRFVDTRRIVPYLLTAEVKAMRRYATNLETRDMAKEQREHIRELKVMSGRPIHPLQEPGNRAGDGGTVRAAVLGANDGLVSNFSLVMGVAGGVDSADFVVLAGLAGLLAGAFSMAAGEYVSMRSQREIYEYQIQLEKTELEEWPEEGQKDITRTYEAKGLPIADAQRVAKHIMTNPALALETMIREHLGLNPENLGSPWGAALSSFFAFSAGAILPVLPYLAGGGELAFTLSSVVSGLGLAIVGAGVALASGRKVVWGALRMLLIGGAAAAVTFGIGTLIGGQVLN